MNLHVSRSTFRIPALVLAFHLALLFIQAVMIAPLVSGNTHLLGPLGFFAADGLGVVLGVVWCLAGAAAAWQARDELSSNRQLGGGFCLMTLGVLGVFYSSQPFALYLAWEVAGLGLWLALRGPAQDIVSDSERRASILKLARSPGWILFVAGLPLLVAILLGLVPPFTPPAGGIAQPWSLPVTLAMSAVVLIRAGCFPFDGWMRLYIRERQGLSAFVLSLYMIAAPTLLTRMLVAAPFDAGSVWALALLGAVALLLSVAVPYLRTHPDVWLPTSAFVAMAIIGFSLASRSPIAAAGAVAVMLSAMLCIPTLSTCTRFLRAIIFAGALSGVWLLAQGALGLHYGVVAVLLLPVFVVICLKSNTQHPIPSTRLPLTAVILVLVAIYPQVLAEFALRPAVGAMAGGVGALTSLMTDWGVGLAVASGQEAIVASLPATGIAVAIFLVWALLFWLRQIAARFLPTPAPEAKVE